MVRPISLITKLKIELSDAIATYRASMDADDKQESVVLEHLAALILQIPSSHDVIHPNQESMFTKIKKLWIYVDSMDVGFFDNPKTTLIERLKAILTKDKYSFENVFQEYLQYVDEQEFNFNTLNIELMQIKDQLQHKAIEIAQLKTQKDETERWMFSIEQKYALIFKEQEENKLKIDDLQRQMEHANIQIKMYCKEIEDKKQLIEKLKSVKKAKRLKQKELSKKIEEITNKIISKASRTINFIHETGVATTNKPDPLKELNAGLETLEKTLKELQQEKDILAQKIATLTSTIEKEISEKLVLKDKLHTVEKTKEELEQAKAKLQGELEQLKRNSQVLKTELERIQENLKTIQDKYEETVTQKNFLTTNYSIMEVKLQQEIESRQSLEIKNEVLFGENSDKEKSIIVAKENIEKLKLTLEDQARKFKDQLKNQTARSEKELELLRKSYGSKEQSLKQQLQIIEKQLKNLESKISIQEAQKQISDNEIRLLKEDMTAKLANLESLVTENEAVKKELLTLKSQLDIITHRNDELANNNMHLGLQITEMEKVKTELEDQHKTLVERIKMLQNISPPSSPQKVNLSKFPFFNKKVTINDNLDSNTQHQHGT